MPGRFAVTVVASVPAPATPLAVRFKVTTRFVPAAPSVADVVPALMDTVAESLSVMLMVREPLAVAGPVALSA